MSRALGVRCARCGASVLPADVYCERCGTSLAQAGDLSRYGCGTCRAGREAIDRDGTCTRCGTPSHRVLDAGRAAAITHRGRVRARNEDAVILESAGDTGVAVVVCDGVSLSAHPDAAAAGAARAAGDELGAALRSDATDLEAATGAAMAAAQRAVAGLPDRRETELPPPASTYVSAARRLGDVTVGWVGDSRAYWIGSRPRLLTADNSVSAERARTSGAAAGRGSATSHAITRWLGADAPDGPDQILTFAPSGPGLVIVCSDGLWNYAPSTADIGRVVAMIGPEATAADVALALVMTSLEAGGRDNITVGVIDCREHDAGPPGGRRARVRGGGFR